LLLPVFILLTGPTSTQTTIMGQASVIDGDKIEIIGQPIRLLDIDAPESRQMCTKAGGTAWQCGNQAALALASWIDHRVVVCESEFADRHGNHLARCSVDGEDMASWLAANGWAVPDPNCHCEEVRTLVADAQSAKKGIWSGSFMMPWQFRQSR
jgi:endonuclease YncB( thermonuclease family)